MRRTAAGLSPDGDDDMAAAALERIPVGDYVAVDVRKERNIKHSRLFWGMCGKLGRAIDLPSRVIADVLLIRTGFFTPVTLHDGELVRVPDSLSFSNMDQQTFARFFNECCRIICSEWLPHMTPGKWRAEVLQMMGIPWDEDDEPTDAARGN